MTRLRRGARSTFDSLSVRNFRLFFIGQSISQVGTWLTSVALTLLVLHLTGSGVAIGVLVACSFAPVLVLGAWAGLVADRSDKRRLLLIVQSGQLLQSVALAVLAFLPDPPLVAFYAAALVGGVLTAFDAPARRAFVVEMVPVDKVQNAVTLNSALMTGSRVFGPALAGLLVVTVGYGWCFTVDAISYLAVLAGLAMMRTSELRRPPLAVKGKGQVREGIRYVRSKPELFIPMMMMAVIGTFAFNFTVVMPLFVVRSLSGSDITYTVLFSVLSLGSLVGALAMARRRDTNVHHIVLAAAAFGGSMAVLAISPTVPSAFVVAFVVGAASIGFMTGSTALVQLRADPTMRGRVLALQTIVFMGTTPLGGPLLGWISDTAGPRAGIAVGAAAALGAAGWGHLADRSVADPELTLTAADALAAVEITGEALEPA
jgi:MFS family permease